MAAQRLIAFSLWQNRGARARAQAKITAGARKQPTVNNKPEIDVD